VLKLTDFSSRRPDYNRYESSPEPVNLISEPIEEVRGGTENINADLVGQALGTKRTIEEIHPEGATMGEETGRGKRIKRPTQALQQMIETKECSADDCVERTGRLEDGEKLCGLFVMCRGPACSRPYVSGMITFGAALGELTHDISVAY
jgi:hypothetical protein